MADVHYTYTRTDTGTTIAEHAPDARPASGGGPTFTVWRGNAEWIATCHYCGYIAASGPARRRVAAEMWRSQEHRYCFAGLFRTEVDDRLNYTYTRKLPGGRFTVEEHEPHDPPEYVDGTSYTLYRDGAQWVADCNYCGNWAAVSDTHEGAAAHAFAAHTDWDCSEHLGGLARDREKQRILDRIAAARA